MIFQCPINLLSKELVFHECTAKFAQDVFGRYLSEHYDIYKFEAPPGHEARSLATIQPQAWLLSPHHFGWPCHRPRLLGHNWMTLVMTFPDSWHLGCSPFWWRRTLVCWPMVACAPSTCCIEVWLQALVSFTALTLNHGLNWIVFALFWWYMAWLLWLWLDWLDIIEDEVEEERNRLANQRKKSLKSPFHKLLTGPGSWCHMTC